MLLTERIRRNCGMESVDKKEGKRGPALAAESLALPQITAGAGGKVTLNITMPFGVLVITS